MIDGDFTFLQLVEPKLNITILYWGNLCWTNFKTVGLILSLAAKCGCGFFFLPVDFCKCCQLLIVTVCVSRGEVISKAGPEETIIYADIGEHKEWCDCFCTCHWCRKTRGLLRLVVCAQSLCFHVWPVPRPAVLGRHPAADSHHHSAPGRPLQGDVCPGRIGLNSATPREEPTPCSRSLSNQEMLFSSWKHEKQPAQSLIHWCQYVARCLIKDGTVIYNKIKLNFSQVFFLLLIVQKTPRKQYIYFSVCSLLPR